jgi:hypothetical protein
MGPLVEEPGRPSENSCLPGPCYHAQIFKGDPTKIGAEPAVDEVNNDAP